ncbi:MAG: helix-turn-helix domain-containing protein [Actinobacteria bacterium]|nr:helix-turn-helix domain-containing protein [Actinomycetota bacterium]
MEGGDIPRPQCISTVGCVGGAAGQATGIKEARTRAGLTQAQLAHAAGTSQPTLSAYESGAKSPSVRTRDRIVRATGASLDVRLASP